MPNKIILLIIVIFVNSSLFAQEKKLQKYYTDSSIIKLIDKQKLETLLQKKDQISVLMIFTNYCAGTAWLLPFSNELKNRYNDSIQLILCSCTQPAGFKNLQGIITKYKVETSPIYWISSRVYKDNKRDDRVKGQLFRDDICETCREDIIGVPYIIIYKGEEIMNKGYLGRSDIRESMEKLLQTQRK